MSPERRHGSRRRQDGGDKPAKRTKRGEVSLEDRLKPTTPPGSSGTTILPGGPSAPTSAPGASKTRSTPKAAPRSDETTILPGSPSTTRAEPPSRRQLRQQREEQKRQARRRWILTGAAVLGVVVLGVLLAVFLAGRGDDEPTAAPVGRTERTLAVTLARDTDPATSGALMVYDVDHGSAGSVLIPSRLFVEGSTPQGMPFGETVQLPSDAAPGTSLADTLDVVVDDTWQVSDGMLASLVDAADGVLVDVDVDVLAGPAGGPQQVVVQAGDSQLLTGAEAVAFANYLGPDENEESRLARFSQVLDQVTQRLPAERAALLQTLEKVDATGRATLDDASLADFLLGYGDIARGGDATYQTLPVNTIESGGPKPSLVVDPEGLERLRSGLLADSLPPDAGGQQITVLVENGVGTPGLEQDAAKLLREQGYEFLNGGNASSFGVDETVVLIPDITPASQALGDDVAATLGLPSTAVKVSNQGSTLADVIVVLGADFKP